jgi:hypothetical protein
MPSTTLGKNLQPHSHLLANNAVSFHPLSFILTLQTRADYAPNYQTMNGGRSYG